MNHYQHFQNLQTEFRVDIQPIQESIQAYEAAMTEYSTLISWGDNIPETVKQTAARRVSKKMHDLKMRLGFIKSHIKA